MEALARLATRRPVAVCVVAAALVVLGWTSWQNLPLDLLPDLTRYLTFCKHYFSTN